VSMLGLGLLLVNQFMNTGRRRGFAAPKSLVLDSRALLKLSSRSCGEDSSSYSSIVWWGSMVPYKNHMI
jgi:hypothetical protein